ncbi:hypothetical protein OGAPHI_001534 [Ogataea philodendri]|uniref:Cysteine proteinase 1, mitochondrial n=1 Tax=Ogataea philodendri TaxID=1378263 RepID=A0A9P8PBV5_9ASCO|nr:uncharacterized protein OGAPHI_001534 [Ogataea philodendri]KAH3669413.1 hypothetical protein OGAPHI_001534 [Ogataea philodendri]
MSEISTSALDQWTQSFENDPISKLAGSVLQHGNVDELLINRSREIADSHVFNTKLEQEGAPVTAQKASGRCWLFASTNLLRLKLMSKYNLKEVQLSPTYLFFYDKLEKANYFLDQICQTYKEDVNSQLVQFFLTDPICDGGQFAMMTNIVDKYGLVPNSLYPESHSSSSSHVLNRLLLTKLREYAQVLREKLAAGESVEEDKKKMVAEIYRLQSIFLGLPPSPDAEFTWEFYDKDGKFQSVTSTPKKFVKEVVEFDTPEYISLLNDPRNEYNRVIKIDRLGNVVGREPVSYLNVEIDRLADAVVTRIKNNKAVFFGTDTPKFMDSSRGVMDIDLWDYKLIGYDHRAVDKASRVIYHESLMTHAMLITAVHLDENGKPVRYRVENSWSKTKGNEGYYVMTHDYFKEYVYQIVCEKSEVQDLVHLLDTDPIVLPPYDPMGALAKM